MPIDLPTRSQAEAPPERLPGHFRRHSKSGAPYVAHPTETKKRTGRKADLIEQCHAAGIEVPDGAKVADLVELLGPEPRLVMYGRPSSLGKQIENMTNLQKWSERAVALGIHVDPQLVAPLASLDDDQLNLDDDQARALLDEIAVKAKNVAQAGLAAERGTHVHQLTEDHDEGRSWIERARDGEDLGLSEAQQAALVEAFEHMCQVNGLEILAVEANVVDDRWRQAGTLDRIAVLTRDLRFTMPTGEIITLPLGTVIVLDVKTGRLRCEGGIVQYWLGYSVQIASYAQAVPYDPDTDTRGEWDWPIDQRWALIAHLDVLAAIDGEAKCRLVLVDLEAGRHAGDLCVAAREWEKRTDVFSLVDGPDETTVSVVVEPAPVDFEASSDDFEASSDDFEAPVAVPQSAAVPDAAEPPIVDAPTVDDGFAATTEVPARASVVAAPADLRAEMIRRDDCGHLPSADRQELDALIDTVAASPSKAMVNAWVAQAAQVDVGWNPRVKPTERRFQILRAAHNMSLLLDHRESEAGARALIAAVVDSDQPEQTHTVGHWLGVLSTDEAIALADMAAAGLDPDTDLAASAA